MTGVLGRRAEITEYENKHEFLHVFNMIHVRLCVSAAGVCVFAAVSA